MRKGVLHNQTNIIFYFINMKSRSRLDNKLLIIMLYNSFTNDNKKEKASEMIASKKIILKFTNKVLSHI